MGHRRELLDHLDRLLRPPLPLWLVDQLERVVELAVAGNPTEGVEIDCRRYTVDEAVEDYELEELVARARAARAEEV